MNPIFETDLRIGTSAAELLKISSDLPSSETFQTALLSKDIQVTREETTIRTGTYPVYRKSKETYLKAHGNVCLKMVIKKTAAS